MDSALNFARLKELVTLGKSSSGQEVEKFSELKSKSLKRTSNKLRETS